MQYLAWQDVPEPQQVELERRASALGSLCQINILSNMNLHTLALDKEKLAAVMWFGHSNQEVSFDICVHPDYRGFGVCTKLVEIGLAEAVEWEEAGFELVLDVIQDGLVNMLIRQGLEIWKSYPGRTIMKRNS